MKKIISYLLMLTLVIGMCPAIVANASTWDGTSATSFAKGDGSADSPYEIATAAELALARDLINANANGEAGKSYKLTADIDLCNVLWEPIAKFNEFTGTLDGNGHVIRNVYVDKNTQEADKSAVAFIARMKGTVKDLGLDGVVVYNSAKRNSNSTNRVDTIGGFVGRCWGTISNCFIKNAVVKQKISDFSGAGTAAFAGVLHTGANINNCYVYNAEIANGQDNSGAGFFAHTADASGISVTNCYSAKVEYNLTGCSHGNFSTVYGFGRDDVLNSTVTNCYSEMDDIAGTWKPDALYKPAQSKGVVGATKDAIVKIFANYDGYTVDLNINDGYPCLAWETWDGSTAESFAVGNGTTDSPYQISTPAELMLAAKIVNDGTKLDAHFILMNDIDLNGAEWAPIGTVANRFRGTFDGNEHVVKNMKVTCAKNSDATNLILYHNVGFFGYTLGATVKDLGVDNINVDIYNHNNNNNNTVNSNYPGNGRVSNIGGFVAVGNGTFENCFVKNSIVRNSKPDCNEGGGVGAFVANAEKGSFKNCYTYNVGLFSGQTKSIAGFFGITHASNDVLIENCYAADAYRTPDITGNNKGAVYGFGGSANPNLTIKNCWSTMADAYTIYTLNAIPNATVDANKKGNTGRTLADIERAIVTDGSAFKTDAYFNGGYPALKWEEKPYENKYIVSGFSKQMKKVYVYANEQVPGAKTYVVAYDKNGRYLESQVVPVSTETAMTVTGDKIGVFVWDENLNPLALQYFDLPKMLEYTPGVTEYGLNIVTGGPKGDAYAWVGTAPDGTSAVTSAGVDANGEGKSHYIYWSFTDSLENRFIKWEDKNLTFEITYLDTTGPLKFVYNSIAPEDDKQNWMSARKQVVITNEMGNTNTWKTAVVKVDDAELKNSNGSSGGSFGIVVPSGSRDNIYIKSVKVTHSGLYVN